MKSLIAVLGIAATAAVGQVQSSSTTFIGNQIANAKGQVDSTTVTNNLVDAAGQGGVGIAGGFDAYYVDSGAAPWGLGDYAVAMDAVFGAGNWGAATYLDDPNILFSADFLYLEGSDTSADELSTWLGANTAALENWVANGGNLFINAAPNEGGNIAFPFGVTLTYIDFSEQGNATGPHPIFDGPFTPVTTNYTGNFFGHGTVSGPISSIIENEFNVSVIGEVTGTGGTVMVGGMTAPFWVTPQPESQNLLQNIIAYVSGGGGGGPITPGENFYYVDSGSAPWGLDDYANAMDAVFGAGNWTPATYADDALTLLSDAAFIYFEGSDNSADELNTWLGSNTAALEEWTNNGGKFYMNAAPNEGGDIALPFGATLTYIDFSEEGIASIAHPIFDGPFTPVTTNYTGNFFGHGTISGGGTTVIENEFGSPVVTEPAVTNGAVMYGGMAGPFWQEPQPESQNLLQNILNYVAFGVGITPGGAAYYLDSGTAPWGLGDYALAMDAVFGAGNWTAATYADDAATILADAGFLYLEGSDSSADELNAWLGANGAALEGWVNGGGNLYINAGPNEGGNIAFPFGVTLIYTDFSSNGDATGPHPIFDGPFTPVATNYTGNFFGHGTVTGAPNSVIQNEFSSTVLGESVTTGGGIVMYGGMTAPFWQEPQPESQNLLQNIISYVSGGEVGCYADCDDDGALTILDFVCFQTAFTSGDPYADCDDDGAFTILDFVCFQTEFTAGCP